MQIEEEEIDNDNIFPSSTNNNELSLRKPKTGKENKKLKKQKKNLSNALLPGEIELQGEEIIFSNKKRIRDISDIEEIKKGGNIFNISSDIEKQAYDKAVEIWKLLLPRPTPGLSPDDYDTKDHDRREQIVNNILKNDEILKGQNSLALNTKNSNVFSTVLENFNTFCYYNNKFMIDSISILDKIVLKAFELDNPKNNIPLVLKFSDQIFEFGFIKNEDNEKYANFWIDILLDKNRSSLLDKIERAKIYLYYIIYLILHSSMDEINIGEQKFNLFLFQALNDLNVNDYEITEVIIKLISIIFDNIIFPRLLKDEKIIDVHVIRDIIVRIFNLLTEIFKKINEIEIELIIIDDDINYIIRHSFIIITKIISGYNAKNEKDTETQKLLVSQGNMEFIYQFIVEMSKFKLDDKNYNWLLDTLSRLAEISYYSQLFLKDEMKKIIFEKLYLSGGSNSIDYVQFLRSLLEVDDLFSNYSIDNNFYDILNNIDIENCPLPLAIQFGFIAHSLVEKMSINHINSKKIFIKMCSIQMKEKVEQIYFRFKKVEIIKINSEEVLKYLDGEEKKIDMEEETSQ